MFRKKKIDVEMVIAQNADEAMNFMFAGIKYFILRRAIRTTIVLLILLGGALYTVIDVYQNITRAKARIERNIKP
jgi:hypothetical protein